MRTARLLVLLAVLAGVATCAGSARSAAAAPTGLHGFLLRADEPQSTTFSRTPSFAWNPIAGALHYEFQLSLSTTFHDNSVIYDDSNAVTPVDAPTLTLPWITGSPHALYARVRAFTADGATPWSDSFGFDMAPGPAPTPLQSYPGLLRWTPIEGAAGYQVWLIDAKKIEASTTNSLDEREFYTFHPTTGWTGSVRWRIRAMRNDSSVGSARLNGIPAVTYGPWSSIYTSTNPATTGGAIKLVGTVSDVFSNGSPGSPAHKLMPAFLWTGNQALDGTSTELYRIYVFTDKQCLNRVFTGAVTGAPAYSPRPMGPLSLPTSPAGLASARSSYLPDGTEPPSLTYDGSTVTTSESAAPAAPTTTVPGAPGASTGGTSSTPAPSAPSAPATGSAPGTLTVTGQIGAPIDLWDTNWPSSGYYWTVVAVSATAPPTATTTVGPGGAKAADTTLSVTGNPFNIGDSITIGSGANSESAVITAAAGNLLTLAGALKFGHAAGEPVVRTGGSLTYQDVELPQDVCAAGRVMRFGKDSEPSLTSSGQLFATGLSSDGRLTSALHTTSFYGQPLVSWTPALGAEAYEVQWSKTSYPFNPETTASGAAGFLTSGTSAVLPVTAGTWYYRVRGFDYSLPTGAQQMSWSDPSKLVVAQPKFKILTPVTAPTKTPAKKATTSASGLRVVTGTGFTIGVPAGWKQKTGPAGELLYAAPTGGAAVVVHPSAGRNGIPWAEWQLQIKNALVGEYGPTTSVATVVLPAGRAVRVALTDKLNGQDFNDVQYYVDGGSTTYIVTFSESASQNGAVLPTFAKIIASLRLSS